MFIYPSEHQPHKATRMAFGAHPRICSVKLAAGVCRDQADIVRAIARFEPVNLLVTKENRAVAQQSLSDTVTYIDCPLDDIWLRDSGANFIYDTLTQHPAAVSFNFNGWGGKQTAKHDANIAAVMAQYTDMPLHISPLTPYPASAYQSD